MKCPCCFGAMTSGRLIGDRYRSKWMADGESLFLGIWATGGLAIGRLRLMQRPRIRAHRCEACALIIIDLKDPEN